MTFFIVTVWTCDLFTVTVLLWPFDFDIFIRDSTILLGFAYIMGFGLNWSNPKYRYNWSYHLSKILEWLEQNISGKPCLDLVPFQSTHCHNKQIGAKHPPLGVGVLSFRFLSFLRCLSKYSYFCLLPYQFMDFFLEKAGFCLPKITKKRNSLVVSHSFCKIWPFSIFWFWFCSKIFGLFAVQNYNWGSKIANRTKAIILMLTDDEWNATHTFF